jgi:hypothetical protein
MQPEDEDVARQPYAMPVFYHGGVYLGLLAVHQQPPVDRVWTELAWSPDTKHWHRVDKGTPLIPLSEKVLDYDYGCIYACAYPVFLGDEIRLYYGASDYLHYGWRSGSLCLATLRPDGFAGYEQEDMDRPAVVTTTAIPYSGEEIRINADVAKEGSIEVSVLSKDGSVLSKAQTVSKTVNDGPLQLEKRIPVGEIRLRFELSSAKLCSFSLSSKDGTVQCSVED